MSDNPSPLDNLEVNSEGKYVLVSLNPKIYPLEVVYSAAYTFIDRAYVIFDGNISEEILVELRLKKKDQDLTILGREFNNELVNYAASAVQSFKNQEVRDAIVRRAFLTNSGSSKSTDDIVSDPEGIAQPWKQPESKD